MSQGTVEKVESGKDEPEGRKGYPKAIPFILSHVLFDRCASGGIVAILALFLHQKLHFDSDTSTALFHVNELILYFFTIIFIIVADSWLGMFKTITYSTLLSSVGSAIITIVSISYFGLPIELSLVGLLIHVIASSGLKSTSNVFGCNQFHLPEQEQQLNTYLSSQYFASKSGLLVGQILLPILRNDVKCMGSDDCFPLAFGVAAGLLLLNFFIFVCGRSNYVQVKPSGDVHENGFVRVCGCCLNAVKERFFNPKAESKGHWLDYATDKYGHKAVEETKIAINILEMFMFLPIFWALYGQSNSRWVFQATQMDGDIGWYTIKPDQMVMTLTIFIIILIPIFENFVFPVLMKVGITTPLGRMFCGFSSAGIAFVISAIVEWQINTQPKLGMLWLLPQYFFIAIGEVCVWVSALSFAYTQAPESMKSVITAFIYITVAGGSLIVIVISGTHVITSQVHEYLFYVCLMIINNILFVMMARRYKFVELK